MSSNSLAAAGLIGALLSLVSLATIDGPAPSGSDAPSAPPPRPSVSGPAVRALRSGGRLDINRASAQELELLPGIGPRLAERIVADRREQGAYTEIEALGRVRGIGERTLARLEPLLEVGPIP